MDNTPSMAQSSAAGAGNIYNALFMDHVNHPDYNYVIEKPTHTHEGVNPSCGDELTFYLVVEGEGDAARITDASYQGHGCAISQASADMMCDCILDKTPAQAGDMCGLFGRMIRGELRESDDVAQLDDAALLKDISHMPARVKCAELAWRTLEEMLGVPSTLNTDDAAGARCMVSPSHVNEL